MSEGRRRALAGLGAVCLALVGIGVFDKALAATILFGCAVVLLVYAILEPQIARWWRARRLKPAPDHAAARLPPVDPGPDLPARELTDEEAAFLFGPPDRPDEPSSTNAATRAW